MKMIRRFRPRKPLAVMRGSRIHFGTRVFRTQCFREDFDNRQCPFGGQKFIVDVQRPRLLILASLVLLPYVDLAGIENGLSRDAVD